MTVLVPIRYPLAEMSKKTLQRAVEEAEERGDLLVVMHVNLYYDKRSVTSKDLRRAVRNALGGLPEGEYIVKEGLLVEETILEEAVKRRVDLVVIGRDQRPKWKQMMDRLLSRPDVEDYLGDQWEGEVEVVD